MNFNYFLVYIFISIGSFECFRHKVSLNSIFRKSITLNSFSEQDIKDYFNRPGVWDNKDLDTLMDANKAWARRKAETNPSYFDVHKLGHAPKILWIGCGDARVPANEMINEPPGSVFVHRNVANQVVNTDVNCMSAVQFAVDVLQVKHIVVCGHYDCGGIRAALERVDHYSPLENWLRNIRDVYRLHKDELNAITDPVARQRRLVEINVVEQCLNIFKTAVVQKKRVETRARVGKDSELDFSYPRVHAFVYEPSTGAMTKLNVNFAEFLNDLSEIYALYDSPVPGRDSSDNTLKNVENVTLNTETGTILEVDLAPLVEARTRGKGLNKNVRLNIEITLDQGDDIQPDESEILEMETDNSEEIVEFTD